ncbi:hypothetical protein CHS0354_005102 [Potamilus streckersoni]|uniref:VWFA domain-containing protein n=1 Tax=Potamilus streckersoni TaxID=2493646 RepID=A0AAE0SH21_9BIVA|nr:hypothetical protein CHS0354_005102 [Potamilus streckersoni]
MENGLLPILPPGGQFDILFSFDTTGSMSSVLDEIRARMNDTIQRLQADIPGIRFGVIAHGDYCDKDVFYVEKHVDFTNDIKELVDFVTQTDGTGGGDPEECYELILKMAAENFSWSLGSQRALVVIGDSIPHDASYELNTEKIDWRVEVDKLANMGVKIYGVQAFDNAEAIPFFHEIAIKTGGHHLKLGEFSNICDFIIAICYRERGDMFLEGYETEVRSRQKTELHKDLEGLFTTLRRDDSASSVGLHSGEENRSPDTSLISLRQSSSFAPASGTTYSFGGDSAQVISVAGSLNPPPTAASPATRFKNRKIGLRRSAKASSVPRGMATKSNVTDIKKSRVRKLEKIYREKIPETRFVLKKLKWSPWKLAWTSDVRKTTTKGWKADSKAGYRRKNLFKDMREHTLYEVAVQTKLHGRKVVVLSKFLQAKKQARSTRWMGRIFRQRYIKRQLRTVINHACDIFVRRVTFSRLSARRKLKLNMLRKTYDYAWTGHQKGNHRNLTRDSIQISHDFSSLWATVP